MTQWSKACKTFLHKFRVKNTASLDPSTMRSPTCSTIFLINMEASKLTRKKPRKFSSHPQIFSRLRCQRSRTFSSQKLFYPSNRNPACNRLRRSKIRVKKEPVTQILDIVPWWIYTASSSKSNSRISTTIRDHLLMVSTCWKSALRANLNPTSKCTKTLVASNLKLLTRVTYQVPLVTRFQKQQI